ncbi:MAG TPA: bifunctional demethylmenaquinone methyltransferase/2-methoxy-6-polyprenyl-1,4-benzoquinol methylase UbiE [Capsulimonadaceae bacterium]|nr:bifunctional demethylmenaquinone methyltransferase/2-methoxy-6-polyprenyl-1,4-benzoquinol methylase UbiE [Capsulimonadaceae bacterium]
MAMASPSGIKVLDQPVSPGEKARYVRSLFDSIAPRYDLLNSILSFTIHSRWRAYAARCAALKAGDTALDVCCGTGDFAGELRRRVGPTGRVLGIDFSLPMLRAGQSKVETENIATAQADALRLPFPNNAFHAAVIGFGLRNVADPAAGLSEMARVVKPGGRVVCMEFSQPRTRLLQSLYALYSLRVMPMVGGLVSGRREAYSYLPQSVARWKSREELSELMRMAGLQDVRFRDLTFGIVCVHTGTKP